MFARMRSHWRGIWKRAEMEHELDDEMRFHLEARAEDLMRSGMSREEARRRARLEFGTVDKAKEATREARGVSFLDSLAQDLRFGARMLRKSPGFTAVAVLTLALGIGANTAIFTIVENVFLRPLPVAHPEELVVLAFRQGHGPLLTPFSLADYQDIRAEASAQFADMIGYQVGYDGLGRNGKADRALTNYVTGNYFSMLGVRAYLGRMYLPAEGSVAGADPEIVLSFSYWKTHFGADASLVGKNVEVNGHPLQVIGVAPEGFQGIYPFAKVDAYIPFGMLATCEAGWPAGFMTSRILQNLQVVGRLNAGVRVKEAEAGLGVISRRLSEEYPETDRGMTLSVYPEWLARPDPETSVTLSRAAEFFLALVIVVLMLACTNVASFLLVRATNREREMGMRLALGAPRLRLIRQMLTETLLLAFAGGTAGLLLGWGGIRVMAGVQLPQGLPGHFEMSLDWRIFAYIFLATLAAGVAAGMAPALRASRIQPGDVLHCGGRGEVAGRQRLRSTLVAVQVGGSLVLLVFAGLFMKSLERVQGVRLGFDPRGVTDFTMDPAELGYTQAQCYAFYQSLLGRVRSAPGVESAALTSGNDLTGVSNDDYLKIEGKQNPAGQGPPLVPYSVISEGNFENLRATITRGRDFNAGDRRGSKYVAIVNEAFAARFWPGENPLGRRFSKLSGPTNPVYEVVGVASDSRFSSLTGPILPYFYLPLAQDYELSTLQILQVRSAERGDAVVREVEGEIHTLAPGLPVFDVQPLTKSLDSLGGYLLFRMGAGIAGALGLLSLTLAAIGVFGVISYSVRQRTQEIGVRMALGAKPAGILILVVSDGLRLAGAGVSLGILAALFSAPWAKGLLAGVNPLDPGLYFVVAGILASISVAACAIPARRAMRVDPMVALRHE